MTDSVPAASTRLLRGSGDRLFQRLRALLDERDVDPRAAVSADLFPDDTDQELDVVVTADRRLIQFVVHYGRGDLKAQAAGAVMGAWRDITSGWEATAHAPNIRIVLRLLPEG